MSKPGVKSKIAGCCVLAVDPGRRKCGLAVVARPGGILEHLVVACREFSETFCDLYTRYHPKVVLLGSSTGSKVIESEIRGRLGFGPRLVDEKHTTELAKLRYFQEYPPKGVWRMVPLGLQTPPTCYDDFAAVVMAERYLEKEGCL